MTESRRPQEQPPTMESTKHPIYHHYSRSHDHGHNVQDHHPLASPDRSKHTHHHHHQNEDDVGHSSSPRRHPHETDPMLPPQHHLQHPKPTHHPSHTLAHAEAISIDNDHLAPIPPPKTPDTPTGTYTPLSKRLFNALVNKPTLSRTWEKKSYADQQRSAPLDGEMDIEQGQARGYRSPRSRPISFYASPAEIAAFRPLPMIETNGHVDHAHSAPVTPAAPTMG